MQVSGVKSMNNRSAEDHTTSIKHVNVSVVKNTTIVQLAMTHT